MSTSKSSSKSSQQQVALVRAIRKAHARLRKADDYPSSEGVVQFSVRDIFAFAEALYQEGVRV
jgi:hypothetical protein